MPEEPGRSKFDPATREDPQVLEPGALFPPRGHRYLSQEDVAELRRLALSGGDVTLPARSVLEIVCDMVNMTEELAAPADDAAERRVSETHDCDGPGAVSDSSSNVATPDATPLGGGPGLPLDHRPLSDDELAAIDARAGAATTGPWEVLLHDEGDYSRGGAYAFVLAYVPRGADGNQVFHELNVIKVCHQDWPPTVPDADFIAHARCDVPALVAEVRRLRALETVVRAARNRCAQEDAEEPDSYLDLHTISWSPTFTRAEVQAIVASLYAGKEGEEP